jgi:hypothetical protein
MVNNTKNNHLVDTITVVELDWVGPEPRGIASCITSTTRGVFNAIEEESETSGWTPNWEVFTVEPDERIVSHFSGNSFSMYEFVLKELGFRLLFNDFAVTVFRICRIRTRGSDTSYSGFVA